MELPQWLVLLVGRLVCENALLRSELDQRKLDPGPWYRTPVDEYGRALPTSVTSDGGLRWEARVVGEADAR